MSTVYKSIDPRLHKPIALKLLAPQLAVDESASLRFMREARAMAQISSDQIIDLYAVEEHEGIPLLVMEYFEAVSLQQLITDRYHFSILELLSIAKQVALALEAAHEKGFIHRDVKPSNVLINRDGKRVKLTDFGLVYSIEDERLSRTGQVSGTPLYMSPEQASGGTVDHRSDLFSLGTLLYTCCSLQAPFQATTVNAVMRNVCEQQLVSLSHYRDDLPPPFIQLIDSLLRKAPASRPASATEVVNTVNALCQERRWNLDDPRSAKFSVVAPHTRPQMPHTWLRMGYIITAMFAISLAFYVWPKQKEANSELPLPKVQLESVQADAPGIASLPLSPTEAAAWQQSWSKWSGKPIEFTNAIDMQFVLIPPGEFEMGSPEQKLRQLQAEHDHGGLFYRELFNHLLCETPVRSVRITKPFYLSKTEVTVGAFRRFIESTGYMTEAEKDGTGGVSRAIGLERRQSPDITWRTPGYAITDRFPVTQVSWNDCMAFCRWLSDTEGVEYTLPTEAQWELACRSGFAGFELPPSQMEAQTWSNYRESIIPKEVARLKPNAFGLYDTLGNVQEWCRDWLDKHPRGETQVIIDPMGPDSGESHVLKGGNFGDPDWSVRPATRTPPRAEDPCSDRYGFRVLREMDTR